MRVAAHQTRPNAEFTKEMVQKKVLRSGAVRIWGKREYCVRNLILEKAVL